MSLSADLLTRAKAGLSNPAVVTSSRVNKAMAEALEIIGKKDIPNAEKIDLGYFRLKLIVGSDLDESEIKMYEKLLGRIDKASTVKTVGGKTEKHTQKALVGQMKNIYQ